MMFLLIQYPYDPNWASLVIDPSTGANIVFDSKDEAQSYAEKTLIHQWIVVDLLKTKGGNIYHA